MTFTERELNELRAEYAELRAHVQAKGRTVMLGAQPEIDNIARRLAEIERTVEEHDSDEHWGEELEQAACATSDALRHAWERLARASAGDE